MMLVSHYDLTESIVLYSYNTKYSYFARIDPHILTHKHTYTHAYMAQAKDRGTRLVLMPSGMSKRERNTSHYLAKGKNAAGSVVRGGIIKWKVYVVFIMGTAYHPTSLLRMEVDTTKGPNSLSFSDDGQLIGLEMNPMDENLTVLEALTNFLAPTPVS